MWGAEHSPLPFRITISINPKFKSNKELSDEEESEGKQAGNQIRPQENEESRHEARQKNDEENEKISRQSEEKEKIKQFTSPF